MGQSSKIRVILCFIYIIFFVIEAEARLIEVGKKMKYVSIKEALKECKSGDTVLVNGGKYLEGNLIIDKSILFIGKDFPILDGQFKYEILSIKANNVVVRGFNIIRSGIAALSDPGGIKVYDAHNVTIENNKLFDNFFGIYLQYCSKCIVKNNSIIAHGVEEQSIGNAIHCWKSDNLQIIANRVSGHRDGIYFEAVTNSIIWRNISSNNKRYGLHFMFSNNDSYICNIFKNNGAGVSVMFTNKVKMFNNYFLQNWGDASYGIMLKEISDSYIVGNKFISNTTAIYMEGANRVEINKNVFSMNGWGIRIQASCMDNKICFNNFLGNTFDIATNGSLVMNVFDANYWDKYEGYDLNNDNVGDVPYHPLSLFSVIVERNPPAMLLFRSFMISLIDKSEKIIPSLTPDNFIDNKPFMHKLLL